MRREKPLQCPGARPVQVTERGSCYTPQGREPEWSLPDPAGFYGEALRQGTPALQVFCTRRNSKGGLLHRACAPPSTSGQGKGREGAPCPAASMEEGKGLPALPGAHGLCEEQIARVPTVGG